MFFPLALSNVPSQQPGRRGSHVGFLDSLEFHARTCQCEKWPPPPPGCFLSSHLLLCPHHRGFAVSLADIWPTQPSTSLPLHKLLALKVILGPGRVHSHKQPETARPICAGNSRVSDTWMAPKGGEGDVSWVGISP